MPKTKKAKVPTFLHVGVGVSQKTLAVAFRTLSGDVSDHEFPNTDAGIEALLVLIRAGRHPRRVLLEATGTYSLALSFALHDGGVPIMVGNPLATRRFAEALLRRAKTDRVDARVLLEFCERMEFEPWTPPPLVVRQLREISRRIQY